MSQSQLAKSIITETVHMDNETGYKDGVGWTTVQKIHPY